MRAFEEQAFDFPAFARALVARDAPAWLAFYTDDAEWIEYKHTHPPRSPRRMIGRPAIAEFIEEITASDLTLEIGDEVIGPTRAAFRVLVTLSDGRQIIEHTIIHYTNGKITRMVDVEAWDPVL